MVRRNKNEKLKVKTYDNLGVGNLQRRRCQSAEMVIPTEGFQWCNVLRNLNHSFPSNNLSCLDIQRIHVRLSRTLEKSDQPVRGEVFLLGRGNVEETTHSVEGLRIQSFEKGGYLLFQISGKPLKRWMDIFTLSALYC
jgi:hypothetical protein